jgi:serine/threonine protein kinase
MDPRLAKHLKTCKLDSKRYSKLISVFKRMAIRYKTADEFVNKFAEKCYANENDRHLAKIQAKTFIDFLFGGADDVLKYGPEVAVGRRLHEIYPKKKDGKKVKPISLKIIRKATSDKLSEYLHESEDHNLEKHPMWTRRLEKYLVGPTLGIGGTAKVKLAYDPKSRNKVALKILNPKYAESAEKEIRLLKKLNHKNIVKIYDCYSNVLWNENITTVFAIEYANQGEFIEYLMYTSKFEDELARWFFISLVDGLEYCHGMNIIHRDLKHDNCLLGENFVLKISDFGFATECINEMMKTAIGTANYAAPEILNGRKYTSAVDIFSMGVMLFIALAGSQPWRKASAKSDRWFKLVYAGEWNKFFDCHHRSHTFTPKQKKILMGLLEPNPKKRWMLKQIKGCEWFNGKQISQNEVAFLLRERKRVVDKKKFMAMKAGSKTQHRCIDIFSPDLPYVYFQPPPVLSFVTNKKAEWVLDDIHDVIVSFKGTVRKNRKKYKLNFELTKRVDSGMYNKESKVKEIENVRVCASVQIWTHPGQKEILKDRKKIIATITENKESTVTEEMKEIMAKNIPPIKSLVIFQCEGGSEMRYLFPSIYSDILLALPADIIDNEVHDDDERKL